MSARVVSKNLFNFKLTGKLDEDVKAMADAEKLAFESPEVKQIIERFTELQEKNDDKSNMEFVTMFRAGCAPYAEALKASPKFKNGVEQTITTSLEIVLSTPLPPH